MGGGLTRLAAARAVGVALVLAYGFVARGGCKRGKLGDDALGLRLPFWAWFMVRSCDLARLGHPILAFQAAIA